ncbi:MAG: PC4/YdbC family ssDNA-binding protein [Eubacteriales bacterium]|nr:PC4/YdbC family ssDNA-binding protein [Eubacteriales bacterium]
MAEFKYEVKAQLGVLSSSKSGWNRELNMVSWNGNKAKLDIRDWAPDHSKMGKGVSLNQEEAAILRTLLEDLNLDEVFQD